MEDVAGYRDPQGEVEKLGMANELFGAVGRRRQRLGYYVNHKLVNEGPALHEKAGILFQSEGAEVYFKTMELRPVLGR